MLNSGAVGNASRYFITLTKQKALNRRAVVIGTIVKGMKVVREVNFHQPRLGNRVLRMDCHYKT